MQQDEKKSIGWAVVGVMVTEVFIDPPAHTLSEPTLRMRKWFSVFPALRKRRRRESKQVGGLVSV